MDKTMLFAALAATITAATVEGVGDVRVRQLTVAESDNLKKLAQQDGASNTEFGLRLLVATLVDDADAPVFTTDDLPALTQACGQKIDALVAKVIEVNGLGAGKN